MSRLIGRSHPCVRPFFAAVAATDVCVGSGGRGPAGDNILVSFAELTPNAAAQDQQASVLAGVERVGHARPGPPTETIRLVVIASAIAVQRPTRTIHCLLLRKR